ncbi:hypothetical protein E2C01_022295 [Portunus trituberculatus]|uniref:Uncharacterized protein n=1 Tax=Portunus trituberculatus TaxID=210409 RepID=A0A5B7E5L7_PORTR|nr:hypothetical protein [Portunus trituberculatus]
MSTTYIGTYDINSRWVSFSSLPPMSSSSWRNQQDGLPPRAAQGRPSCLPPQHKGSQSHQGEGGLTSSWCLVTPGTAWQVHHTLTSDHFATLTTLPVAPPAPPRPRHLRWNIRRANWASFKLPSPSGGPPTSRLRICTSRRGT